MKQIILRNQKVINNLSCLDKLSTLRDAALSDSTSVHLPSMNQPHFIAMWRTFYDIFIEHKLEQEAYHSIVKL